MGLNCEEDFIQDHCLRGEDLLQRGETEFNSIEKNTKGRRIVKLLGEIVEKY